VNSIKVIFLLIYVSYPHYVMYMHCFGVITYNMYLIQRLKYSLIEFLRIELICDTWKKYVAYWHESLCFDWFNSN